MTASEREPDDLRFLLERMQRAHEGVDGRMLITGTTIATLTAAIQRIEQGAREADRWQEICRRVFVSRKVNGGHCLNILLPDMPDVDLLHGSIVGHMETAIDAAIAAKGGG